MSIIAVFILFCSLIVFTHVNILIPVIYKLYRVFTVVVFFYSVVVKESSNKVILYMNTQNQKK